MARAFWQHMSGEDTFPPNVIEFLGLHSAGAEDARVRAVHGAGTEVPAWILRSSQVLAFARLRSGRPGKMPLPTDDLYAEVPARVHAALSCSATGSPKTVRQRPGELIAAEVLGSMDALIKPA
jgi:hypothetical protein